MPPSGKTSKPSLIQSANPIPGGTSSAPYFLLLAWPCDTNVPQQPLSARNGIHLPSRTSYYYYKDKAGQASNKHIRFPPPVGRMLLPDLSGGVLTGNVVVVDRCAYLLYGIMCCALFRSRLFFGIGQGDLQGIDFRCDSSAKLVEKCPPPACRRSIVHYLVP